MTVDIKDRYIFQNYYIDKKKIMRSNLLES